VLFEIQSVLIMAYFPSAYRKVFVGDTFVTSGKTEDLTAGQFGFFDAKTWTAIPSANANITTHPEAVLTVGSYHTVDIIGNQGGYKESLKSQIINPRHVQRYWKVRGRSALQQVVWVGWDGTNASTAPKFECGQNYHFRIDLKGSPALRFLGHNLSRIFDVSTGCCADASSPQAVDPVEVMLNYADQINQDPVFSHFISADVLTLDGSNQLQLADPNNYTPVTNPATIATMVAALRLTTAYYGTVFYDCSFDPRDYVEQEPLIIAGAQLVDENGAQCPAFKQLTFTQKAEPRSADGTSEQIKRDHILSNNYRQEIFHPDARRREIEDMNVIFSYLSGSYLYHSYYILYSVPRKSNPLSVYDNDLYLLQLSVNEYTDMSDFETWLNNYISSAQTGLTLEDRSGSGS
jgi:hypothetical protein